MTSDSSPVPDWTSALADRYAVEGVLGAGGMAVVYAARDLRHGRRVAIKVVTDAEHGLLLARFAREVEFAARLQHPNIVPLYESGVAAGVPYYVMPLVEGQSLAGRLAHEGRMPTAAAVAVVTDVARALGHAHAHGVVHRDVKPANVLLSGGVAVVTDFGIARAVHAPTAAAGAAPSLTHAGSSVGTPNYMSPEQALGGLDVDARSDVYSLACVAFELFTGVPPYAGPTAQAVVAGHLGGAVPSASAVDPRLPPAVDAVLRRGLAKDPDDRFASAEAFAAALAEAAAPRPRLTLRTLAGAVLPRRARRALLAAGVLALGAGGWAAWRAHAAPAPLVVVLPFEARGPAADQDFADGMTDEITTRIASLPGLGVISRASVLRYDARGKTMRQVGRDFGADYVLTGAVRFDPGADGARAVRVQPRLTRAREDRELWSRSFDSSMRPGALFAAQTQVAESVATQLDVAIVPLEAAARAGAGTASPEAYALYLRGLAARARRYDPASTLRAIELFRAATATDTTFAPAYARLAQTEVLAYRTSGPSPARAAAARAALARAAALDASLPDVHLARAWVAQILPDAAGRNDAQLASDLDAVRRVRPNDPDLLSLIGGVARRRGRWDEALAAYERAAELNPREESAALDVAATLLAMRRLGEADRWIDRVAALTPPDPSVELLRYGVLSLQGDSAGARRAIDAGVRRFGTAAMLTALLPRYHWQVVCTGGPLLDSLRALRLGQLPIDSGTYYLAKADAFAPKSARALALYDSALAVWTRRAAAHAPDDATLVQLAYARAGVGRRDEALATADSALALRPPARDAWQGPVLLEDAMRVAVRVQAWSLARARVDELLARPAAFTVDLLRIDPEFAAAREQRAFTDLLRGAPAASAVACARCGRW